MTCLVFAAAAAATWLDHVERQLGMPTTCALTLRDALECLESWPTLILIDVSRDDGSVVALAEAAAGKRPMPRMIAIGESASAADCFRLGQLGVLGYISEPCGERLGLAIRGLLHDAPDFVPPLAANVGRLRLPETVALVRRTMAEQALALSQGNRTEAARLLGVTRQAVQQCIRELGLKLPD